MSKESDLSGTNLAFPEPGEGFSVPEVEAYPGQIEWHRFAAGDGRLYRLGLIELSDLAGRRFLGGANSHYRLVVLLDARGIGQAYPFCMGGQHDGGYLALEYVQEKLGRALFNRRDAFNFTRALAALLERQVLGQGEEEAAG